MLPFWMSLNPAVVRQLSMGGVPVSFPYTRTIWHTTNLTPDGRQHNVTYGLLPALLHGSSPGQEATKHHSNYVAPEVMKPQHTCIAAEL